MKKLLASASLLVLGAASAVAADLPMKAAPYVAPAPVFSWTGCYIGGHVGWGWSKPKFNDARSNSEGVSFIDESDEGRQASTKSSGALFGGQVGCDYQFAGNWVIGVSGSAAAADINAGNVYSSIFSEEGFPVNSKTDFLGDISARLGITFGQALFYAKGGWGTAHTQYSTFVCCSGGIATAHSSNNGGLAGAGIEWTFIPNMTFFVEYNHYFLNSKTLPFQQFEDGNLGDFGYVHVKQSIDTVKFGANYRFNLGGGPVVAKY
jgi:outer membrane immunogenic protein